MEKGRKNQERKEVKYMMCIFRVSVKFLCNLVK
jgi:hypothetical protein